MDPEVILFFTLVVTVLWLVIGWRAMKAHEKLADQAQRANDRLRQLDTVDVQGPLRDQSRRYRDFVKQNPEVENLTSKDRHERFREWEIEQGES